MRINRRGVTRIVLIFRTVVVKIPNFTCQWDHFLRGLIGNISEGKTWRWNSGAYEKGTSHLLCPVLWTSWGGWILVMRRAEPVTDGNYKLYDNAEHMKHFAGDDTISNYALLDGRLVKIDYADLDGAWGDDFEPDGEQS